MHLFKYLPAFLELCLWIQNTDVWIIFQWKKPPWSMEMERRPFQSNLHQHTWANGLDYGQCCQPPPGDRRRAMQKKKGTWQWLEYIRVQDKYEFCYCICIDLWRSLPLLCGFCNNWTTQTWEWTLLSLAYWSNLLREWTIGTRSLMVDHPW